MSCILAVHLGRLGMVRKHDLQNIDDAGDDFLSAVARRCGQLAVERLCAERGGTDVVIPRVPRPHHVLCQLLGVEGVKGLVEDWGWGRAAVPLGQFATTPRRSARAAAMFSAGRTTAEVARDLGVTYRTATRYRQALRKSK